MLDLTDIAQQRWAIVPHPVLYGSMLHGCGPRWDGMTLSNTCIRGDVDEPWLHLAVAQVAPTNDVQVDRLGLSQWDARAFMQVQQVYSIVDADVWAATIGISPPEDVEQYEDSPWTMTMVDDPDHALCVIPSASIVPLPQARHVGAGLASHLVKRLAESMSGLRNADLALALERCLQCSGSECWCFDRWNTQHFGTPPKEECHCGVQAIEARSEEWVVAAPDMRHYLDSFLSDLWVKACEQQRKQWCRAYDMGEEYPRWKLYFSRWSPWQGRPSLVMPALQPATSLPGQHRA